MSKKEFGAFLDEHILTKEKTTFDRDAIVTEWRNQLDSLFKSITGFLREFMESGRLEVSLGKMTLSEEGIGSYEVPFLVLTIAGKKVRLTPVGTNVIGAKGRVDMEGSTGKVKFVLVREDYEAPVFKVHMYTEGDVPQRTPDSPISENHSYVWKVATPPPLLRYIDLNEDTFYDCLMEVIDV